MQSLIVRSSKYLTRLTVLINKFISFSFSLIAFIPFRVQRKRNSSEAAKERAAVHSPFYCWSTSGGLPCTARKERTFWEVVKFIPPCGVLRQNVFSALSCAARLREMAYKKNIWQFMYQKKFHPAC